MKKNILYLAAASLLFSFAACKKKLDDKDLWHAVVAAASPISDATCLTGSIKGTMLSGKTYTVCGDIFINEQDTLTIQEGVTLNFGVNAGNNAPVGLGVKGCCASVQKKNL
jgi:hypothetical protein